MLTLFVVAVIIGFWFAFQLNRSLLGSGYASMSVGIGVIVFVGFGTYLLWNNLPRKQSV